MSEPKILLFDIESTRLDAFGTILCIGYKFLDSPKVSVPTIFDYGANNLLDDKGLIVHFSEVYEKADFCVTHYGGRFDIPMIQAKLMRFQLPPLAPIPNIDTWRVCRDTFKFNNNRLNTIQSFLGLPHAKTPLDLSLWIRAAYGDKKALREIVVHCRQDVLVLEDAFKRMRPWIKNEPARHLVTGSSRDSCISCGGNRLQSRGHTLTRTRKYARYQCQGCGKWQRSKHAEPITTELV